MGKAKINQSISVLSRAKGIVRARGLRHGVSLHTIVTSLTKHERPINDSNALSNETPNSLLRSQVRPLGDIIPVR